MRISLRDLFVITAFCAVLFWCASQVGFDNAIFWIVACCSAVMSAVFVWSAGNNNRYWVPVLMLMAAFGLLLLPIGSLALIINVTLLLIAGIVSARRPPMHLRTLCAIAMFCTAMAFVVSVLPGQFEVRKLKAMRREFPIVSLSDRLQYEQQRRRPAGDAGAPISSAVSTRLVEMEQALESLRNYRERHFTNLHNRKYELFVRATGFGVGRMPRTVPAGLRQPALRDIPFDALAVDGLNPERGAWRAFWETGESDNVEDLHLVSRNDFVDPDSFGAVIEKTSQVVGFVEHAMHYPPMSSMKDRELWSIQRLELVSLLRFDEPRVYVLDHLPRMDQLSGADVATRPLDEFETGALRQLSTDEDIVIDEQADGYRMLGSLRAAGQCLNCHTVNRGELLGAFSYVLQQVSNQP